MASASEFFGHRPINVAMGWNEGVESKKDAIDLAKGFIAKRFTAVEASWYAVRPFMGGFMWEVHEGGAGKGYIDAAISALENDPEGKYWLPSGDRAFQVMMRDGKPFGILLSKSDSLAAVNSGQPPLMAKAKMTRAVRRGTATFAFGASMLSAGVLFLLGSAAFFFVSSNPGPEVREVNFSQLPHAQWPLVQGTGPEQIVSRLRLEDGRWAVDMRPHVIAGLREIRADIERAVQAANQITQEIPEDDEETAAPARPALPVRQGGPVSPEPMEDGNAEDQATGAEEGGSGAMPSDVNRVLRDGAPGQVPPAGASGAELPAVPSVPVEGSLGAAMPEQETGE